MDVKVLSILQGRRRKKILRPNLKIELWPLTKQKFLVSIVARRNNADSQSRESKCNETLSGFRASI